MTVSQIDASRWLKQQAAPVRRPLAVATLAGTLQAMLMCAGAWLVAHVLARAIFAGQSLATLWPALLALLVVATARAAAGTRQRRASVEAGGQVSQRIHRLLEERVRSLGPQWTIRQSTGDLVTRLVDGVDALAPYYAGYLPQMCLTMIVPALVLLTVLCAEPWSALVLLVTMPLVPLFMVLVGKAAAQASERRWIRLRRLGARFMDALSGLTTLRLYRAAEREQALLAATGDAYRRETMAVLRIAFLSALVLEFFATVSIAVVAVLIGFRLMAGTLAFEHGMFALLLAPEFFLPLRALGTQRHQRMEAVAAAEGLLDLLDSPIDATGDTPRPARASLAGDTIGVTFDHVGFGYAADRDVLHDVSLAIPAGTRLTLVGESGSGKSTLLNLLMGFASPQRGRILINGIDLALLDASAWRSRLMWVSQRPHVFHGSLRDNLRLARPDADEFTLRRAIQFAALESLIGRLPAGIDTPLGEHGQGLSGGECQRLALARAWLRDAPVLLLDEPTQHLDQATAASVNHAIDRLAHGRTVIRIAHRLDDIGADEAVAVLAHGRMVERGFAGDLRTANGAFAALLAADRSA
jgi:ATP-binding cassette subfamily C protein CydD